MRTFALALLFSGSSSLLAIACGGSSSETPPPLEPDPTSLRYTGPRLPDARDDAAPLPTPEAESDDAAEQPRRPATTTWGSGKATPSAAPAPKAEPAPSMTSPSALPPKPAPSSAPPSH